MPETISDDDRIEEYVEELRYLIRGVHPDELTYRRLGLDRDGIVPTDYVAWVTPDEYRVMHGPDANIVRSMIHNLHTVSGWTVTIGAEDVLSAESGELSMQHALIGAIREHAGLEAWDDVQTLGAALAYDDISPEAVRFLMAMYDDAERPSDVNMGHQMELLEEYGMGLTDFARP